MHPREQHDKNIDSALKALGKATPPGGINERVLHHASTTALRAKQRGLLFRVTAVASLGCAVAIFATWFINHKQAPAYIVQSVETVPGTNVVTPRSHGSKATPHNIPNAAPKAHTVWLASGSSYHSHADDRAASAPLALAADASDAPSQAAPPLPLTSQERLLLAAAHGESSLPQVAHLRRPVWPLRDPADDEDFARFFDPPTEIATNLGENE